MDIVRDVAGSLGLPDLDRIHSPADAADIGEIDKTDHQYEKKNHTEEYDVSQHLPSPNSSSFYYRQKRKLADSIFLL